MRITLKQREEWQENEAKSPFNQWLNGKVRRGDGTLDLDALYEVARKYGISKEYRHLNPGQQRMLIGKSLRQVVPDRVIGR